MRIEEDKSAISTDVDSSISKIKHRKNKFNENEEEKEEKAKSSKNRSRRSFGCLRFLGCFTLMLLVVVGCTIYFIFSFVGPTVKKIDELPNDFPKQLALYQVDKANIKIQTPADKVKSLQLIKALPSWVISPFLNYLSTEIKTQILARTNQTSADSTVAELESALSEEVNQKTKTVSLTWSNLDKTKEDLFDYYKNELKTSGFEIKENISDYEMNLGFFKEGITGAISITDSFRENDNSLIKMTVNYLNGN